MLLVKQRIQSVCLVLAGLIFLIGLLGEYRDDYEVYFIMLLLVATGGAKHPCVQPIFSDFRNKSC